MKNTIFLLAVLFISTIGFSQNNKMAVYKVGFYNLENLFDTINNNGDYDLEYSPQGARQWTGARDMMKQKNMATAMADVGGDNIGVSESETRLGRA